MLLEQEHIAQLNGAAEDEGVRSRNPKTPYSCVENEMIAINAMTKSCP